MTTFVVGTPNANAKLVRLLTHALTTPHQPETPSPETLLSQCTQALAFSTLTPHDAQPLITAVLTSLKSPQLASTTLATRLIFHLAKASPPPVLSPHCAPLSQTLVSLLKSRPPQPLPAQALTALAALIAAAAPLPALAPDHKPLVSTISQSALSHVARALDTDDPTTVAAALSLVFAVLLSAPRELRSGLSQMERVLWDRCLSHSSHRVRQVAARLYPALVACYAHKIQPRVFEQRLIAACNELQEILSLVDAFTASEQQCTVAVSARVRRMTAQALCDGYASMCAVLSFAMTQHSPLRMTVPLPLILRTLCSGLDERELDPYARGQDSAKLDHDSALSVAATASRLSANTLATVVDACDKAAALPFANVIGVSVNRKLSHIQLRCRDEAGKLAAIPERRSMYEAIGRLVTSLGSVFMDHIIVRFQELFAIDIALYKQILASRNLTLRDSSSTIPENARSRKRRRFNGGQGRNKHSGSQLITQESSDRLKHVFGTTASSSVQALLEAGLNVSTSLFESRGLLTKSVSKHMEKLELSLLGLVETGEVSAHLLRAISAAAISGGANRMAGEASSLLHPCAKLSTDVLRSMFFSSETRRAAVGTRAQCEALIHPRGPPFYTASRIHLTRTTDLGSTMPQDLTKEGPVGNRAQSPENQHARQNGPSLIPSAEEDRGSPRKGRDSPQQQASIDNSETSEEKDTMGNAEEGFMQRNDSGQPVTEKERNDGSEPTPGTSAQDAIQSQRQNPGDPKRQGLPSAIDLQGGSQAKALPSSEGETVVAEAAHGRVEEGSANEPEGTVGGKDVSDVVETLNENLSTPSVEHDEVTREGSPAEARVPMDAKAKYDSMLEEERDLIISLSFDPPDD